MSKDTEYVTLTEAKILFLKRADAFVRLITAERGTLISRTVGLGFINTVYGLLDFENFSFYIDRQQSMVGGNDLKVWYHPGMRFNQNLVPVVDMWWQLEISSAKVSMFDAGKKWQAEFFKAIKRRNDIAFLARQAAEFAKKHVPTQYEEEVRQKHLAEKVRHEEKEI
jgi:hypothetical protein